MRIGIDFDDTIVKTGEAVRKYLKKYNIEGFKDDTEKYNFYKKHIDNITKEIELKDGVKSILDKLSENHELYIITARNTYYSDNIPSLVSDYIKTKKLPIKETYFGCFKEGKADKCLELNIDLFIDDHIENCLAVSSVGIDTLLYENEYDGLKTVNSWKEILTYIEE